MQYITSLPIQKKSFNEKINDNLWLQQCVDACISMTTNDFRGSYESSYVKQKNYDIYNGIVDEEDFKYVTQPYKLNSEYGGQPAQLMMFPLVTPRINKLAGEELKRKFKPKAIIVGGEGLNSINNAKRAKLLEYYKKMVYAELGITNEQLQSEDFQEPAQIIKYYNTTYEDLREQIVNKLIEWSKREYKLKYNFNKGFKHASITAEEIYHVGISNDKPTFRVCDPRLCSYLKSDESEFLQDSFMFKEERYLTYNEIIDEFGEYLDDKQKTNLEKDISHQYSTYSFIPGYMTPVVTIHNDRRSIKKDTTRLIQVYEVCWRSLKKIGKLTYIDSKGKKQIETIFDEDFELTDEQKLDNRNQLEWKWITEIWEGVRIGNGIYCKIKPCEVQTGKLPYCGMVYNSLGNYPTSIVDLLKVVQHIYNVVWYRFNKELAKGKGKKFIMDFAQLPRSQGWDTGQWMYYFDTLDVAWINSKEFGTGDDPNLVTKFNQFSSVDLTLSQSIQQYSLYLRELEKIADDIIGFSPQRKGETSPYESAEGVKTANNNSYTISESYFYQHDICKLSVIEQLIAYCKQAFKNPDNKTLMFLNEDQLRVIIELDTDIFRDSDYGVFMSDNTEDEAVFEMIKNLAREAVQAKMISISDLVKAFKSSSSSEIENIFQEGENRMRQEAESQRQFEAEQSEAQRAFESDKIEKEHNFQLIKQKTELDSKERIKRMEIGLEIGLNDNDLNTPNVDIINTDLKQKEIDLKNNEIKEKQLLEYQKENNKVQNDIIQNQLKDKEIETKLEISENQLKIAKENKNKYDSKSSKNKK